MARRRRPRPRGWYEKQGDPPGTERFWDGEKWGPNPRYKRGAAPPPARVDEPALAAAEPTQSTVWARISARSVDTLVLLFPWYWLFTRAFTTEVGAGGEAVTTTHALYLWLAAAMVIAFDVGFTATWGATPGKRLVGLMIVDRDERKSPPGWGRSILRATPLLLVVAVLLLPLLWLACVVFMFVDKKQRSLFDLSGATLVVIDPRRSDRLARPRKPKAT